MQRHGEFPIGGVQAALSGIRIAHFGFTHSPAVSKPGQSQNPAGEARRLEIIAAHDRWARDRKAADAATGFTAANDAWEAKIRALNAVEDAAKLCQPRTLAGLSRKAAWVADILSREAGDEELGEVFARQVAAFGVAS